MGTTATAGSATELETSRRRVEPDEAQPLHGFGWFLLIPITMLLAMFCVIWLSSIAR